MKYTKEEKNGCAVIRLEGEMTIYEAISLRDLFLQCFERTDGLILDLTAVTECDTAGIQLLCAARKTAENHRKRFVVDGLSEPVSATLAASGIAVERILRAREEV